MAGTKAKAAAPVHAAMAAAADVQAALARKLQEHGACVEAGFKPFAWANHHACAPSASGAAREVRRCLVVFQQ